ncbi:hypothetical protein [Teichococcus oryzae]|uniref:DUF5648 domain-containing protein n=1 Tax=Teichococcus oryzae TaxID=1608942 RepID=A0A5B2T9Z0_9PROT|nr:hypothetical protein [Pseudoroseomonas oryzae]KAA2211401.1 hypothetical protein F0Q34_20235 [Pseudoroseomonas oryzae]
MENPVAAIFLTSPQHTDVGLVQVTEGQDLELTITRDDFSQAHRVELFWTERADPFVISFEIGDTEAKTLRISTPDDFIYSGPQDRPYGWLEMSADAEAIIVLGQFIGTRDFTKFVFDIVENDPVWANGSTPVYRFLNTENGQHFFTASQAEKDQVLASLPSFMLEGVGFQALVNVTAEQPMVYRLLNQNTGVHLYTTSQEELAQIQKTLGHWSLEGGAFKAAGQAEDGLQAVHRFYHTGLDTHFFTTDEQEVASIQADLPHYNYEGIAFYVPDIVMA